MRTPAFLDQLGLSVEVADEREIKRAYARLLKQIDQEADPAGFQKLREAYETALGWLSGRQQTKQAREDSQPPKLASLDEHNAPARTRAMSMNVEPPSPRQVIDPDGKAGEVFASLAVADLRDDDAACHRLESCLGDERLAELEARQHFERRVASLLAGGWRPGHEFLFEAAVTCFKWDVDHGRLSHFGHAGQVIESAIAERDHFHEQAPNVIPLQLDLMQRVRQGRRPSDADLACTMCVFDWLAEGYSTWLGLTVGRNNIQQWDRWHAELPPDRQSIDSAHPEPTHEPDWLGTAGQPRYKVPMSHYWHLFVFVFFCTCFFGALVLGAYLSHRYGWK